MAESSESVDAADDFADGCDVLCDECQRIVTKGPHSLRYREASQFFLGGPTDNQPLDLWCDLHELINTDPVHVSGARAEVAPLSGEELVLWLAARLHVEREVLRRWIVRRLAQRTDAAQQPLSDYGDDRRSDEE